MDHQQQTMSSPIQPIYNNSTNNNSMAYSPQYLTTTHHQEDADEFNIKAAFYSASSSLLSSSSSTPTRSPTTVFAIDEVSSVFRVPDDAIERGGGAGHQHQGHHQDQGPPTILGMGGHCGNDHQEKLVGSTSSSIMLLRRARCLTPSFTTDGELSTFSEDTEDSSSNAHAHGGVDDESSSSNNSSDNDDHFRFPVRVVRRRSSPLQSIFRPASGIKRRSCDYLDDQEEEDGMMLFASSGFGSSSPASNKRSCRGARPLLCHANPIGGSNYSDGSDDDEQHHHHHPPTMPSPARSSSIISSSPFTTCLFSAENTHQAITLTDTTTTVSNTTNYARPFDKNKHLNLAHPLSFETFTTSTFIKQKEN